MMQMCVIIEDPDGSQLATDLLHMKIGGPGVMTINDAYGLFTLVLASSEPCYLYMELVQTTCCS